MHLERGFRELGVDAVAVDVRGHPFDYAPGRRPPRVVRLVAFFGRRRARTPRSQPVRKVAFAVTERVAALPLLVWALTRFDAFVIAYGSFFVVPQEGVLFRLLGKRVLYVFHGSDSRPPYLDGFTMTPGRGRSVEDCIRIARRRKRTVRRAERYGDQVLAYPLHTHLHERPVVFTTLLGIPTPPAPPAAARARGEGVRIVHAPSDPEAKGSDVIRRAVERLRDRGHDVTLVELVGRPNAEVLAELAACDFVIDQAYSEATLAGLGTEAAALGRPTLVGGYAEEALEEIFPPGERPPALYVHPDRIADGVERLALDREFREQLGRAAGEYVRTRWAAAHVSERFLRVLRGDIPPEWLYDPQRLRYVHGCGLPEDAARSLVREVVARGGRAALQVSDKPELEDRLVAFAGD